MDKYTMKYIKAINDATGYESLKAIINKIYEDGFSDGFDEGRKE
jgi:hypothetical protein